MNVENDVQTKGATYQSARPTVAKLVKINKIQTLENMAHNRNSMSFQLYL